MESNNTNEELAKQLNYDLREAVLPVTIFVGIEVAVAFFGNLLVIIVFLFHYHVCNFRYFVLCMAFVDFTSSLTTMPGEMVTQMNWYIYPYKLLCKIKSFFNIFTVTAEALCLLTIAIDRYRKVCTPFGWQIQPNIAIILCGVIYVVAFVIALPVAFFWGIHYAEHKYKNQTIIVTVCEKDEHYIGTDQPFKYSITVDVIISFCLFQMFLLYIFVAKKLVAGKRSIGGKSKCQVIVTISSTQTGASSDLSSKNCIELSSKQETSDAGYSSGAENKPQKNKYNYISSDGGLTTDEEEDSSSHVTTLRVPGVTITGSLADKKSTNNTKSLRRKRSVGMRVRRKTKIMVILTATFITTTILYLTLLALIAKNILRDMSAGWKTIYFFFFRLFFINHVINPFLYGYLDPHFKRVMLQYKNKICGRK